MEIYAALLLLPLVWEAARLAGRRAERAAPFLIWLALTLFIGLRREVGQDWDNYLILFQRGYHYPLETALAISDGAYILAGRGLAALGLGVGALNLLCAAIFSGGLVLVSSMLRRPGLALLIATPVLVMILGMASTRQSAALGLIMIGLYLWRQGRRRTAASLLLFAPFWHVSALLSLPLIPLLLWRRPVSLVAGLLAGPTVGLTLILLSGVPVVDMAVGASTAAPGALPRLLPSVLALAAMLLFWRRLDPGMAQRNLMVAWAGLVMVLACVVLVAPMVADRVGFYAVLGQMAVLTCLPDVFGSPRARFATALIALPYLVLFLGWLVLTPYRGCWAPYRSYLSAPADLFVSDAIERVRRTGCATGPDQANR